METTSPSALEAIYLYGGVSLNCWTRTHHAPATWEEGQGIARVLADGGQHKIAALYPAGVALRQETLALRSKDVPVISREELFPCTRMTVEKVAVAPKILPVSPPVIFNEPPRAAPAPAAVGAQDGLFSGVDW